MKRLLSFLILLSAISCSHKQVANPPSGDIAYGAEAATYQAEYKGKEPLQVGDKVRIMEYDFGDSLKHKQSRNFPLSSSKRQIGEATVSNVLSNNFYELSTDKPQHLPGNAFIEKL
jgi:hypothetical protein